MEYINNYEYGFMRKCAEYGIDGTELLKLAGKGRALYRAGTRLRKRLGKHLSKARPTPKKFKGKGRKLISKLQSDNPSLIEGGNSMLPVPSGANRQLASGGKLPAVIEPEPIYNEGIYGRFGRRNRGPIIEGEILNDFGTPRPSMSGAIVPRTSMPVASTPNPVTEPLNSRKRRLAKILAGAGILGASGAAIHHNVTDIPIDDLDYNVY